ncbi:helix-turn-helix domain-containing protein [Aeromicrobium sp. IC_218]|uniref:helix-turn-helix domain-containing protein n=1 Tax=Aeromicrobium sp. IC_218 TaxID=2545468 RepID=UPI001F60B7B4|nr:helix-turn-helix domain-containing protein [Aeromicrobium sp. IC_218]
MSAVATRGLMLTARDAARRLGVDVEQLRRWRRAGTGPAWVRLGRSIRYHPDALDTWESTTQDRG